MIKDKHMHDLYFNAYCKTVRVASDNKDLKPNISRLIFYGVKAVNTKEKPDTIMNYEAEFNFQFAEIIKMFMGSLTPKEFMTIFPIDKDYRGYKHQCKDYFHTMNYINTLDMDKPIGTEIDNFLWEYTSDDILTFMVESFGYIDDLRRLKGQPGMMEEFCEEKGIATYTRHTDGTGREYLLDGRTGKTLRIRKARPKYLKAL